MVRQEDTEKLKVQLPSQGFIISSLLGHSLTTLNSLWSFVQNKLPKNIFYFTMQYLNNTSYLHESSQMEAVSVTRLFFCMYPDPLLHIATGCKSYFKDGRYTWRHFTASSTSDHLHPNVLLSIETDALYIIELTVGFETNIDLNAEKKYDKYLQLTHNLSSMFPLC